MRLLLSKFGNFSKQHVGSYSTSRYCFAVPQSVGLQYRNSVCSSTPTISCQIRSVEQQHKNQAFLMSMSKSLSSSSLLSHPATADLCDLYVSSPTRLAVAEPGHFKDFGGIQAFSGQIETVRCFESNPMVRQTLSTPGEGRILIVDGGGSQRVAIMGDEIAKLASQNNWAGVIINGCIRDSKVIRTIPIGVKALNTHPLKSLKDYVGERGCAVSFAGVEFVPGYWVYADEDGIVISEKQLSLESLV
mmetsp:Transcript_5609/g.6215  ORF Transcript_5609/g.6215 Transcript_5609/m.6215 type:complete len:246 (-) Transcript_5609:103-840(-)|eukprot:CAMPEP_0195251290 /NCGR_PEP_ID=MMETSP0706-20130129/3198_1 /TAXON_ID=33640 /ORGANISM="Asterionellopsis glacialis, Strain CCMP134" /LENGTH=245 /DNA_ID=CAMNT_0040303405 /DNA_START=124 /DNA_END=861 /DNA_ORIENTATION=+